VIHAATEVRADLNAPDLHPTLDTIINGTWRTLEFARQCQAAKFLLISSGAVYGQQPPELAYLPEEYTGAPDPLNPRSAYGEGKRVAELLCALYAKQFGLHTNIARCFAFVGLTCHWTRTSPWEIFFRRAWTASLFRSGETGQRIDLISMRQI